MAAFGATSLLVGLLLAVRPRVGIVAVAWLVGAYAVAVGAILLAMAFALRAADDESDESVAPEAELPEERTPSA